MERVYNFSAGPAVLPEEVLKEAAAEMLNYNGSGMSVMEMSHRSKTYQAIIDELNRRIDENPEVHTAGWIPGHNWKGTVFYPIYLACKKDKTALPLPV